LDPDDFFGCNSWYLAKSGSCSGRKDTNPTFPIAVILDMAQKNFLDGRIVMHDEDEDYIYIYTDTSTHNSGSAMDPLFTRLDYTLAGITVWCI
jgi:hypothetical protein